ncbi:tRNA pseudouridine(55) synthase TruB [Holospora curviuscula]|uniref:tRNA pseudouridine synthase B n=1 Tax=Holospora curviuscula TaxID=1082868 RepID=A0A2S5R878_9PROT|nr:tRNA pseudouridine(55) synthase TruB [Holospora curviuscula]PPE03497.1 tRNA pseudouridine synthase B [Holospora curviuscula]
MNLHGWLVVWKQPGIVCTRIDRRVKRWLGCSVKVGHAGTLDPFAEGILPIAFGWGTRMIPFLLDFPKMYQFTCVWGRATDTQDLTGTIIRESSVRPSYEAVAQVLPKFLGVSFQKPCMYSAVKINGKPAYTWARKGKILDLPPRPIVIHTARLITEASAYDGHSIEIEILCSSGTYVRAFAGDLAEALGTLAYVSKLTRVSVGPFSSTEAVNVDTVTELCPQDAQQWMYPMDYGLKFPEIDLTQEQTVRLWNGLPLYLDLPFFSEFWVCKYQKKMICLAKGEAYGLVPYRCFVDSRVKKQT